MSLGRRKMVNIAFPSIWLFMMTVLLIRCTSVHSISSDEIETINNGLEIGKSIAELLEKMEFEQVLTKIGKGVGPFLGAIGPFIGIISTFFQSESAELAYMKKMMKYIDSRFDQMDKRFDNIEQMIKWNVVQVNFGQIEQRIKAMEHELRNLYSVPSEAVENRKKIYILHYESDYQNSGTKLYHAIVNNQSIFQEDLCTSVLRYTDNDRKMTQVFLLGVMKLLLQAVKIELAYLYVNKYIHNANFTKSLWINRIKEVQKKFNDTDVHCINVYLSESKEDIDEYLKKNKGTKFKTKNGFVTGLFNLLAGKYYWRDWIVFAYNHVYNKYQIGRVSGGYMMKITKYGRLLVTSVDKNHPVANFSRAEQKMKTRPMTYRSGNWFRGYKNYLRPVRYVYNSLDKTDASLVSITMCWDKIIISCDTKRLLTVDRCPTYKLAMWG
ncbi:uncharacterized protein LOC143075402 [Mytilus galloprovincialis]|uniref:uncharacterized protein LOC143075402 n=1 Tax=Mytilus galloprovincialis TaxID=29158 RepID=UPI003F7B8BF7